MLEAMVGVVFGAMLVPADWQGSGDLIKTPGAGFGIQGSRLRVQGVGFRIHGFGVRGTASRLTVPHRATLL